MKFLSQLWRKGATTLPPEFFAGVAEISTPRRLWQGALPTWAAARGATVAVYQVPLVAGGQQARAILQRPGQAPHYLGALTAVLPETPIAMLLFELQAERFWVGWVDERLPDDLQFVDYERVEPDPTRWLQAVKSSVVHQRVVFLPFAKPEARPWMQVQRLAIKTRTSLQQGAHSRTARASVWEKTYQPPVDLTPWCVMVKDHQPVNR